MSERYITCNRCGIPFTLSATALQKRKERGMDNLAKCRDCLTKPQQLDLNAVWAFYVRSKRQMR